MGRKWSSKMKKMITLLAVAGLVLTLAPAAQADLITIAFSNASADDGTLDSATETFTQNVAAFNGTDASFDLVVTAVAENGTWIEQNSDLGITWTGENNFNWDQAGENGDFTVTIANFVAGTSGYTEANVDFGMRDLFLGASSGPNDSGDFDLINGVAPAPALIWTDTNNGDDFTGNLDDHFDLQVMNGDVRVTSFSLNNAGGSSNAWRVRDLDIEYDYTVDAPSPPTGTVFIIQ